MTLLRKTVHNSVDKLQDPVQALATASNRHTLLTEGYFVNTREERCQIIVGVVEIGQGGFQGTEEIWGESIAAKRIATECSIEYRFKSKKPTALEEVRERRRRHHGSLTTHHG